MRPTTASFEVKDRTGVRFRRRFLDPIDPKPILEPVGNTRSAAPRDADDSLLYEAEAERRGARSERERRSRERGASRHR